MKSEAGLKQLPPPTMLALLEAFEGRKGGALFHLPTISGPLSIDCYPPYYVGKTSFQGCGTGVLSTM